eukprot:TRINITY_DN8944_c0_g1_i1.p2 TRINITY_DN8944_c0_g1~~TRINITY_DN8944_c0_g1_i1.p2  ORF type:complete len:691 (+),score=70.96 TRINITY_DN8944_c0_g1_i1:134-2206(+)
MTSFSIAYCRKKQSVACSHIFLALVVFICTVSLLQGEDDYGFSPQAARSIDLSTEDQYQTPVEAPILRPTPAQSNACNKPTKPNIIVIMTDDQGHDDIGFYNTNGILQTPNMDKFAQESVQFDNFYTDSLCAPTRASLLTGRHHLRTGVWGVHGGMDYINLDELLIPQALKNAGYATAQFGKWHSGTTPGYNPWDRGFDLSYVTYLYTFIDNLVKKNGYDMQTYGWVEDWLADRIIEYLYERQQDGQPFFILWTPMSIHQGRMYQWEGYEEFVAPDQYKEKYYGQVEGELVTVFAAIEYFDSVLGRVMQKITEYGFDDNTVMMLFGDNGPLLYGTDHQWGWGRDQRVPSFMSEEKGYIEENGIRNFFFVRGLNQFPAGREVEENVGVIDIFPSIMDLAGLPRNGGAKHSLDGKSFVPLLCQEGTWKHSDRSLFFHEVLKNDLQPNHILALGDDRQVWLEQQLLKFEGGGSNKEGFLYNTGLKWKQYKYVKSNLFDLKANDHKEYHGESLWSQDYQKAKELGDRFYGEVARWWQSILSEPGAFAKPVFLIGYQQTYDSPVRLNAPIERSGSIYVDDQVVRGFKQEGDYLMYHVRIETPGTYRVTLQFGWNGYKGAVMQIAVGSYKNIQKEKAPMLERKIDRNGPVGFGEFYLEKTPEGRTDEVLLKMVGLESTDWSEVFAWMSDIEFELLG